MKFICLMAALATANAVKISDDWSGVGDLATNVQPKEWCPDFDERMVLKDGATPAVAWPEKGYNCKTFHTVLGNNASPYSQNGGPGWN